MAEWGGAQWVLATLFVLMTAWPPICRASLILKGYEAKKSRLDFWSEWLADCIIRGCLVGVLIWGGFW